MVTEEMWSRYFENRNIENRNAIVEGYRRYVIYLVNSTNYKVPEGLSKDDLIQSGQCGLIEAVERFNPVNGNKFETYAKIRIQGSIYDYIRSFKKSNLGISRIKSTKIKEIIEMKSSLEQQLKRTPTKQEIADAMNIRVEEYEKILQDKEVKVFYEEDAMDKRSAKDTNQSIETPEESFIKKEELEFLNEKISELKEDQQTVLRLYYFDEKNFKQIGEVLSKTESRISQIHKKAINRLKYLFEDKV